jgi:hypothetical protein
MFVATGNSVDSDDGDGGDSDVGSLLYGGCGVREDQGRGEKMEVM